MSALSGTALTRVFGIGVGEVHALRGVDLAVDAGELLVVRGSSGSGKTTLLNILGGLDAPTSGSVHLGDRELSAMTEDELLDVRRHRLAYIFQSFGLIPFLSATENVEVPLRLLEVDVAERADRVAAALSAVGLQGHSRQRPAELSGGQQQRVAIARALVVEPSVLLADEPTGQLDSGNAAHITELLAELVHSRGVAAVVTTHDPLVAQRADRVVELASGTLRG
jgi:putative ABC transport system ATP-binding protein